MQIRLIVAAAAGFVVLLPGPTAGAADMDTEPAPQAAPAQDATMKTETPAATVSVRNTRPKVDRHKDARACLDAVDNKAIIKCANKYR